MKHLFDEEKHFKCMVMTRFWVILAHVVLAEPIPHGYKHETHLLEVANLFFLRAFYIFTRVGT